MNPGIELVKWLGFAAMLYDHAAFYGGVDLPLANHIGAFAFPFFALAIGAALSQVPAGKRREVVQRLFVWALGTQIVCLLVRDGLPLNVLFTLAFGILLFEIWQAPKSASKFLSVAVVTVVSLLTEFAFFGSLLVALSIWSFTEEKPAWVLMLAAFPLFAFNEGSLMSIGAVYVGFALIQHGARLPRIQRVFYPLYVLQWPVLRYLF